MREFRFLVFDLYGVCVGCGGVTVRAGGFD